MQMISFSIGNKMNAKKRMSEREKHYHVIKYNFDQACILTVQYAVPVLLLL